MMRQTIKKIIKFVTKPIVVFLFKFANTFTPWLKQPIKKQIAKYPKIETVLRNWVGKPKYSVNNEPIVIKKQDFCSVTKPFGKVEIIHIPCDFFANLNEYEKRMLEKRLQHAIKSFNERMA